MTKKHLDSQQKQPKNCNETEALWTRRAETWFLGDEPWAIVFPDNSSIVGMSISTARKSGIPENLLKQCKCIEIPDTGYTEG